MIVNIRHNAQMCTDWRNTCMLKVQWTQNDRTYMGDENRNYRNCLLIQLKHGLWCGQQLLYEWPFYPHIWCIKTAMISKITANFVRWCDVALGLNKRAMFFWLLNSSEGSCFVFLATYKSVVFPVSNAIPLWSEVFMKLECIFSYKSTRNMELLSSLKLILVSLRIRLI